MSSQQRARITFVSAVILLLLSAVVAYVTITRLRAAQDIVTHTRGVQATLADLRSATGRASLARTQYVTSGESRFIQEYDSAASQTLAALRRLRELTADNPAQQANCGRLEEVTNRRLALLSHAIDLKRAGQSADAANAEVSSQIVSAYAEMDSLLQSMNQTEQRLLDVRTDRASQLFHVAVFVMAGTFLLSLILLLAYYRLLNAELRARRVAEHAAAEKAHFLDLANDAVFVRRPGGDLLYWNRGAERLYGWTPKEALGQTTEALLRTEFPVSLEQIKQTLSQEGRWEGELVHSKRDGTRIIVSSRWTLLPDEKGGAANWLEINTDITDQKRAEESLRLLSARLLQMQDEERRRIARELHDSAGQMLAALGMNLATLEGQTQMSAVSARVVNECIDLVQELTKELRTISHLLHPPLLDEVGISSALPWYVNGFSERSGIKVDLSIPENFARLSPEAETAIFRIVQECLTNVHRHSGSSVASIRITREANDVQVEVQDQGKSLTPEKRNEMNSLAGAGVGIRGMRERIRQLGGNLSIHSNGNGTTVIARLPATKGTGLGAA